MNLVLVTDIYGVDDHLDSLTAALTADLTTLIDPYQGKRQHFADGSEAYAAFLQQCGHQQYAALVSDQLNRLDGPLTIIAFSSGASAAWRALAAASLAQPAQFWCFYPVQLHQHYKQATDCPTRLILPASEPHFDVSDIAARLAQQPGLKLEKTAWPHGFFNPLSSHYNEQAARHYASALAASRTMA